MRRFAVWSVEYELLSSFGAKIARERAGSLGVFVGHAPDRVLMSPALALAAAGTKAWKKALGGLANQGDLFDEATAAMIEEMTGNEQIHSRQLLELSTRRSGLSRPLRRSTQHTPMTGRSYRALTYGGSTHAEGLRYVRGRDRRAAAAQAARDRLTESAPLPELRGEIEEGGGAGASG